MNCFSKKNRWDCLVAGIFLFMLFLPGRMTAQEKISLTLDQAIGRARNYSPAAIAAQHSFRAAYWNWRSFKADQLPSVYLSSSPSLNRSIQPITNPDGSDSFTRRDQLTIDASVNISQNISFTGGRVYARSALQRIDLFSNDSYAYKSTPVVIGYEQDLFGYNSQKWQRKIQPLRYEEAKKSYIETMETVSRNATQKFFNLAVAQTSWEIARDNYANADTLHCSIRMWITTHTTAITRNTPEHSITTTTCDVINCYPLRNSISAHNR